MQWFQKRYFYYIVYEVQKAGQSQTKSAIELELRNPITSILHCEAIAEYIQETLEQKEAASGKKKKASARKKAGRRPPASKVLLLSFTLLRTKRLFFSKK